MKHLTFGNIVALLIISVVVGFAIFSFTKKETAQEEKYASAMEYMAWNCKMSVDANGVSTCIKSK